MFQSRFRHIWRPFISSSCYFSCKLTTHIFIYKFRDRFAIKTCVCIIENFNVFFFPQFNGTVVAAGSELSVTYARRQPQYNLNNDQTKNSKMWSNEGLISFFSSIFILTKFPNSWTISKWLVCFRFSQLIGQETKRVSRIEKLCNTKTFLINLAVNLSIFSL